MSLTESEMSEDDEIVKLAIYTDGSHRGNKKDKTKIENRHVGMGIWLEFDGVAYEYAGKCEGSIAENMGLTKEEISTISNPTAEFMAYALALGLLLQIFKSVDRKVELTFFNDYSGVEKWMTDQWKAKKPYIQKIKAWVKQQLVRYVEHGRGSVEIKYQHVKGHSGVRGNEEADRLASGSDPVNTFNSLQSMIFAKYK